MADTKKRLPVLKQTPEEEQGADPRPPWHWVGFGSVATFAVWVPLLWLAEALVAKLSARLGDVHDASETATAMNALPADEALRFRLLVIGILLLPWIAGAAFGGYIVGRWGGDNAGVREAAIGGFAAAFIATLLASFAMQGVSAMFVIPLALSAVMAGWGGNYGLKKRIAALTPNMR